MKLSTQSFRGMAPRVTPRGLPDNGAQVALNTKLLTGDLEAWNEPLFIQEVRGGGGRLVRTISLLDDTWLSFRDQVELARGVISGDTTFRTYLTGFEDGPPRFFNYQMAVQGAGPYPAETRLLGVPAPDDVPTITLTQSAIVDGEIAVTNGGFEAGNVSGWTQTSPDMLVYGTTSVPGLLPQAGLWYAYGGTNNSGEFYQSFSASAVSVIDGQSLTLKWYQATGTAGSRAQLGLRFFDSLGVNIGETFADMVTISPIKTWQQRSVSATVPGGTASFRIVIKFQNVGGGVTDAFIDTITLMSSSTDYTSNGDDLGTWSVSAQNGGAKTARDVVEEDIGGEYGEVFKFTADELVPWIHRPFAFTAASAFQIRYDLNLNSTRCKHELGIGNLNGAGEGIGITLAGMTKEVFTSLDAKGQSSASIASFSPTPESQWLRVTIDGARSGSSSFDLTITVTNKETGTVLADAIVTTIAAPGTQLAIRYFANRDADGQAARVDNIMVRVVASSSGGDSLNPDGSVNTVTITSYLYRYVNDFGEASAPSLPSRSIQRTNGVIVTVTTGTDEPAGYGVTTKQIYRVATGSAGSVYRFVAEIPIATENFEDDLEDAELGEILDSEDWDLPPSDMRYILALPNGVMVGASQNQLCFSVQNRPHAWPIKWRLNTDSKITGLGNIDTSVVVGTQTYIYTASGNDPSAYSMSKPGAPQACTSARSFATLLTVGVVFASPDGLIAVNGPTSAVNLTEGIFTREQWQALDPSSVVAEVHDDIYFFFVGENGVGLGYALDMKPSGFGLIRIGLEARYAYADPLTDSLYLLIGGISLINGQLACMVYQWDAGPLKLEYQWGGKLWMLPHPTAMPWARVRAYDYADISIQFTTDDGVLFTKIISSENAFRLPVVNDYSEISYVITGTSRVRTVEIADDVTELT